MRSFPNTPSNRKFSTSKLKKKKKERVISITFYVQQNSHFSKFLDLSVENESRQRIACRLCKKKKKKEKRKKRRLTRETNLLFPFSSIVADNSIDVDGPPYRPGFCLYSGLIASTVSPMSTVCFTVDEPWGHLGSA